MNHHQRDAGCGIAAAVLLILLLVMVGFLAVGLMVYRSASSAEMMRAEAAAQMAMQEAKLAEQRAIEMQREATLAEAGVEEVLEAVEAATLTLAIDAEGTLTLAEEAIELANLAAALKEQNTAYVELVPADDCPFHHVASVLAACRKADVEFTFKSRGE